MLQDSLQSLGIEAIDGEKCIRLVGISTDGALANIAGSCLKGLRQSLHGCFGCGAWHIGTSFYLVGQCSNTIGAAFFLTGVE